MRDVRMAVAPRPPQGPENLEIITAMVTPFHPDGRLNVSGAKDLATYLVDNGSDGLVLAGTTGESPALKVDDQLDLFAAVADAVGDRATLIGGTGANSNEEAIELTRRATELGVLDKLLVVSPYYNRPGQYGIRRYYEAVAEETDLPIVLYNIPIRTGREVSFKTIRRLFNAGKIAAVKDATGGTDMAARIHDEFAGELPVYSGEDGQNLEYLVDGAIGAISVMSHWAGNVMRHQFDAFARGDMELAKQIGKILRPSAEFESVHVHKGKARNTPNPVPAKAMMSHILGETAVGPGKPPMEVSRKNMKYLHKRAPKILAQLEEGMEELGLAS